MVRSLTYVLSKRICYIVMTASRCLECNLLVRWSVYFRWIGLPYLIQMISRWKQRDGIFCVSLLRISSCPKFCSPHLVILGLPILLKCMDVTIKPLRSRSSASMLLSFVVMNLPFHRWLRASWNLEKMTQGATSPFWFLGNAYFLYGVGVNCHGSHFVSRQPLNAAIFWK